ncbi:MAG: TetR/AcrR family transcriptional regulator [Egibacteraceae bacterium]
MAKRVYPSARSRILDAAERVILREGIGRLSVEAVAAEAQVSKGGFFYHFKSKDDLLAALVTRLAETVAAGMAATAEGDPEPRGRLLRAYVRYALGAGEDLARRERLRALALALIAASAESPGVVASAKEANAETFAAAAADGVPIAQVLVVHLALDGLWLGEGLGTLDLPADWRDALAGLLVELTRRDIRNERGARFPSRRDQHEHH